MGSVTGVIQEIQKRSVSGGRTAYNIVVAGESYGVGLYPPKAKEGDYVKFDVDEARGYKNVARNSLKVSTKAPPAEAVAEAKATAGKQDAKQDIIERQSAANTAVAFLAVAQAADALGLPKTDAKGKRLEALEALFKKYTTALYEQNTGKEWKDIAPSGSPEPEVEEHAQDEAAAAAAEADDGWD